MAKLVVEVPCCGSRRQCWDTRKYVIDIEKSTVKEILPVRCLERKGRAIYRNQRSGKIIEVEVDDINNVAVVYHYSSNTNIHYLRFEYPSNPPPELTERVISILKGWYLRGARKVIVRGVDG